MSNVMPQVPQPSARPFLRVLTLWLLAAAALGTSGRIAQLQPPLPQIVIVVLTAALIVAGVLHAGFHTWLAQVTLRGVVAFHVVRFVGVAFLLLYAKGQLPFQFAVPGGWGDIAVATLALGIVLLIPKPETQPRLLMVWNALGLADIVGVVLSAARCALHDPGSMRALLVFPMSLVPTFLVPLVIASHVLVFWRLRRNPWLS